MIRRPPRSTLFPLHDALPISSDLAGRPTLDEDYLVLSTIHSAKGMEWDTVYVLNLVDGDRKSTRLNSSHSQISYAVFCLKKKKNSTNCTINYSSPPCTPYPIH